MKVVQNSEKESLYSYLKRVLPAHGYKYRHVSDEWTGRDCITRKGLFFSMEVAWIKTGPYNIILHDNNLLKTLTEVLPAWEKLSGEIIQVTLAKEVVRA